MRVVAIIPARLASTRFPEKVLASATGKPLVQHVWEAARTARRPHEVVIATDHPRIEAACGAFGARCVMTGDHPNGTSRLEEASRLLCLSQGDVVVNVQGDEPEIEGAVIDASVACLERTGAEVATIASPIADPRDVANPAIVKVVVRQDGLAMYFSRSPIPHSREAARAGEPLALRHVGLYAYRAGFLRAYVALAQTPNERRESLEQLRVLEHGYRIGVHVRETTVTGIDTPEQYEAFVARWRGKQPS
jgi:3-deoxy-manno-octulosonate cytidylyltransferase (CMP-KDO synthetase)